MARPPVRELPRLSASQLADYLAATSPIAQMAILRQAKNPGEARPLIIQYQLARQCISACLIEPETMNRTIAQAITSLEQRRDDAANRPLVRDDARRCIEVINTFQRSVNALGLWGGLRYEAAPQRPASMMVSGVEISVYPDAIAHRGGDRVGQAFIRCTIGGSNDSAENRRQEANSHLAVISHMHAVAHLGHRGTPHAPTSMTIDVPRQRVVYGPSSTTMRVRQVETACAMIAAIWPTI
ncbi:hypothetical protein [Caulobacter sp. RHG1]|uniref:hypothetical protein n=1 Tax=Caulobacter sp. (strain RHG1) TaxID=2545762 RepID=UPI0015547A71|nr:hypothetical protein [Caulobacter sp. RHG1]